MGLATSMSSGLLTFLADGAWSKWMHTGWSAHGGLIAAELAGHGFRGSHHALDFRYGLYGAFLGAQANLDSVTTNLGRDWRGATAQVKIFPCAHVSQPYIEEALAKRASGHFSADTVRSINCVMAPWAMPIVGEPRETKIAPRNDLEAIASLPFMLAAALIEGRVDLATLRPESIARANVLALAARITCEADERLGSGFDGRMEVVYSDGKRATYSVSMQPTRDEQIIAKFRANMLQGPSQAVTELEATLLDGRPSARTIARLAVAANARNGARS
jgi:2-methylcitrate dehydratase PrpD